MDVLAIGLSMVSAIIAAVHLTWAFGSVWPADNELSLARMVVGTKGIKRMPPRVTSAVVALIIFATAFWPLMWRALVPYSLPQGLIWAGMFGIMVAFLVRGVTGYLPMMTNRNTEQPFARLNARYYSPLCLILAAGFALLLYNL